MKKIVLILVLLIVYSCSEDTIEESTVNMQSVTLNADMTSAPAPSLTGKPVQRGSTFASVNTIKVKNTCAEWSYTNYTDFEIVANGTVGASTRFNIDKVYAGNNVFTATTTTTVLPAINTATRGRASGTIDNNNTTIKDLFVTEEAKNPYAVFTEINPVTANIIIGTAQNISIPMKTSNSRIISYFSLLDIAGKNSSNTISVEIYKGGTVATPVGSSSKTYGGYNYRSHGGQSNTNTNLISSGIKIGSNTSADKSTDGLIYLSTDTVIAGDKITFRIIHDDKDKWDIYYFTTTLKAANTGSFLFAINDTTLSIWGM
jgi:hypothetical protein